jgi:hypothetical protein
LKEKIGITDNVIAKSDEDNELDNSNISDD